MAKTKQQNAVAEKLKPHFLTHFSDIAVLNKQEYTGAEKPKMAFCHIFQAWLSLISVRICMR